MRYQLFAGGVRLNQQPSSLVEACSMAKDEACRHPGVKHWVEIDGQAVARYEVVNGQMKVWVK